MSYINKAHQPKPTEVLCSYYLEPAPRNTLMEAAEELCKKASVDVVGGEMVQGLRACAYAVHEEGTQVAFPADLFEGGNIPQMLTIIAGKIFGLEKIANLRLQDVRFPEWWIKSFRGPTYGSGLLAKFFGSPARPLVASLISPEVGLTLASYKEKARASFLGGCDIVRDSPQIRNMPANSFEDRVNTMLALAGECADKTGMPKMYFPNVSGPGDLVLQRTHYVIKQGGQGVVIDFQACGFSMLQMLRNEFPDLVIYADRTSHAATARNKRQGISMTTLGKFARLAGADLVEIGSITGDMVETEAHVVQLHSNLLADLFKTRDPHRFDQNWHGLGNSLPVTSGGLKAADVRGLRLRFGNQVVLQFGRSMTGREHVSPLHVEMFLDELGPLVPLV
ncbi:MAG: RuBisCO large subunit C-terminal-like domain-containing protein [candidate division KSB1 bacterium]|nr:RuBisCO large subunit C-terminal-like domain-containing protein [candidate division KSB1 bacterium]MDZ7272974.1 RuBisCO large subunit C-terminal-like domain-containing protein [candidate division KSB1 bacterium]MDZ7285078.1 RuBisCO large subunit C-terminal-like domain-containing protein [candidate division KSB1 bacterium]MDZ7298110.1 RuBisCO large subunit C-terminal-like domain-containing protein [candidate division KSB1 bacterium]MDZ7308213.1 RuBisCO large subunit C-terminal-like domain-con